MCIAIVKPRGVSLAEDRLRLCFENNPDGAGFAIATDQGVAIHKGYTTFSAFWTAYCAFRVDDHPALVNRYDGWAPRWEDRPRSRYEAKGIAAGRTIYDLCYGIREGGRR